MAEKKYTDTIIKDLLTCKGEQDFDAFRKRHPAFADTSFATLSREKRRLANIYDDTKTLNEQGLYEFLQKGRTMAKIIERFKCEEKEVKAILKKPRKDHQLLTQLNEFGHEIYIYVRKAEKPWVPKEPVFKRAVFYEKDSSPWVVINLPDDVTWKRCDILPLFDVHYGHISHNLEKFKDYVEYIRKTPHVVTFLGGDLIENSNKLSVASGVYEQEIMPDQQIRDIIELLRPIAHKIMFSTPGNHEERSMKTLGVDLGRVIADALDVPYFAEPVYFDVHWKGHSWKFHAQHGSSNSQTHGGRINAASRATTFNEFHHAYFSGHVHNATVQPQTALVRDYENMKVRQKRWYLIILPSFMDYNRTYAARMGWAPPSTGSINFRMFPNGDYHASG